MFLIAVRLCEKLLDAYTDNACDSEGDRHIGEVGACFYRGES